MELFDSDTNRNLLPADGEVNYFGTVLNAVDSQFYYTDFLKNIAWKHDEARIFGKHYITKRKAAWYGDSDYAYTYSGTTKYALPWTPALKQIKSLIEEISQTSYNACLLNLYHDGSEGMAWHSDDEKTLAPDSAIASVSLGAVRKFSFKHKANKQTISLVLENGSLLVMKGSTQRHWLHRLPPTKKVRQPRVNLTFRTILA